MDGTILAGKKQVGSGTIIQTTFSLGDAPLSTDPVYSDLISIYIAVSTSEKYTSMYGYNAKDQLVYDLGETNSLFSSFKVSTPLMIGIVVVYMILIRSFALYIFEKKR